MAETLIPELNMNTPTGNPSAWHQLAAVTPVLELGTLQSYKSSKRILLILNPLQMGKGEDAGHVTIIVREILIE